MGEGGGGNLFMIDIEEDQEEDRKRYSKLTLLRKRKLLSLEQERPLHCLTVADVRRFIGVRIRDDDSNFVPLILFKL